MSRLLLHSLAVGAAMLAAGGAAQTRETGAPVPAPLPADRFQSRGVKVIQPDGGTTVTTTSTKTQTKTPPGPANATTTTITTRTAVTTTPPSRPAAVDAPPPAAPQPTDGAAIAPGWTMQASDQPIATQVTTTTTVAPRTTPATTTVIATTPPPPAQSVIRACARPFARPDLRLGAAAGFDRSLAALLKRGRPVVVDLAQPYPKRGDPPAALKPWLDEIGGSGGIVKGVPYCEATRGAFGSWLSKLFEPDPAKLYRPARGYDAYLQTDSLDNVVTQIEFRPRAAE